MRGRRVVVSYFLVADPQIERRDENQAWFANENRFYDLIRRFHTQHFTYLRTLVKSWICHQ